MLRTGHAIVGVGLLLAVAGCSNHADASAPAAGGSSAKTPAADDLSTFGHLPPVAAAAAGTVRCTYIAGGDAARKVDLPTATGVSAHGTKQVSLNTNQGPIGLTLNRDEAPCTVNAFESLATQGYFDNTPCHRLSTENLRILQCGDPTGTGRGGPGYSYANEYPTTTYEATDRAAQLPVVYPRGTIAMANAGGGNTNGSQFFLVYADSPLPPQYTVFGTIDGPGISTIEKIAAGGDDGSMEAGGGKPNTPVQISKVGG